MDTFYKLFAVGLLALYAMAGLRGWELGGPGERRELPSSVRQSPGGYRSFHFWHSGFQGGK